jgi:hypothetical protein
MRQQSFSMRAAPSLVGGLSVAAVASRMNPWRGVVSLAEYRTTPYRTLLQDHKPATILPNSSELPLKLFSSARKPLATFLRLATR